MTGGGSPKRGRRMLVLATSAAQVGCVISTLLFIAQANASDANRQLLITPGIYIR